MGTDFVANQVWPRITKLARGGPADVAVAYLGRGARKLLPLKRGSRLVVDASERAVKSGQTDPKELLYFIKLGVAVHSARNLHAKVFAFGKTAVVGSMNVSMHSANDLQEAGVVSTAPAVVAGAHRFVEGLLGEEVTAEHAKQLKKLWNPPKFGGGGRRPPGKRPAPAHAPLWVVPLTRVEWDEDDEREANQARPAASKRVRRGKEKLEEFKFAGSLCDRLKTGDLVLQVMKEGRLAYALQAAHVIHVRRFRGARGARRAVVFLAVPLRSRRKKLAAVRAALGRRQHVLPKAWDARLVRDATAAHALLNLWATRTTRPT